MSLIFLWLAVTGASPGALAQERQQATETGIAVKLDRVARGLAGRIGVAAQEIGGTEAITLNGDETFPMASIFKVALAVTVLTRVDEGELALDQMIDISPDMYVPGDNALAQTFVHPGLKLSVANLIETMIALSDNTATDILLKLVGGPAAVTQRLRDVGVTGQRVDRPVAELLRDSRGLADAGASAAPDARRDPPSNSRGTGRNLAFERDPRDQSTPRAMLTLLLAIDEARALSTRSRDFLIASMSRTRTGGARLRGLLPKDTPVAHKTGTLSGIFNDAGYVTLPDGRRFAVAVFTKGSTTSPQDRDRAIAEVTRTLYDYYLLKRQ